MGIFIPQLMVRFNDYYFMMSDYPSDSYNETLDNLKNLCNIANESKFGIEEMIIHECNHGNKVEAEKHINADLSEFQYSERKNICDKYIDQIDYYINSDFSLFGTMQTLYDGTNCMRDGVDEKYICYNLKDLKDCLKCQKYSGKDVNT